MSTIELGDSQYDGCKRSRWYTHANLVLDRVRASKFLDARTLMALSLIDKNMHRTLRGLPMDVVLWKARISDQVTPDHDPRSDCLYVQIHGHISCDHVVSTMTAYFCIRTLSIYNLLCTRIPSSITRLTLSYTTWPRTFVGASGLTTLNLHHVTTAKAAMHALTVKMLPSLSILTLVCVHAYSLLHMLTAPVLHQLQELYINNCDKLETVPIGRSAVVVSLQHLCTLVAVQPLYESSGDEWGRLSRLHIKSVASLRSVHLTGFVHLQHFSIESATCTKDLTLPEGLQIFRGESVPIKALNLWQCPDLKEVVLTLVLGDCAADVLSDLPDTVERLTIIRCPGVTVDTFLRLFDVPRRVLRYVHLQYRPSEKVSFEQLQTPQGWTEYVGRFQLIYNKIQLF
jgi:hypothetical protein